jgi:hypothetical protein
VRATKEDGGLDKEDPPVSLPPFRFFVPPRVVADRWTLGPMRQHSAYAFPPFCVAAWRAPSVSARP